MRISAPWEVSGSGSEPKDSDSTLSSSSNSMGWRINCPSGGGGVVYAICCK